MQDDRDDPSDAEEVRLGPAGRSRLYRQRAAALEAELAETNLPRLREKLTAARDRFIALADAEQRLFEARTRARLPGAPSPSADEALQPVLRLLAGASGDPRRP